MKPHTSNSFFPFLRNSIWALISIISLPLILAFTTVTVYRYEDLLQQLGLTEAQANERISSGLLSSSLNFYGITHLKNIGLNDKVALINNVFTYSKEYVNSEAFQKEYRALRDSKAPKMPRLTNKKAKGGKWHSVPEKNRWKPPVFLHNSGSKRSVTECEQVALRFYYPQAM
jgi:hypothetical protein